MPRYGVVDLASAVGLRSVVTELRPPDGAPLLDPEEFADLLPVGPWIVDLGRAQDVYAAWMEAGRWKNWGWIFDSGADLETLRHHFRKFNLVEVEGSDAPFLFRYFDPVVLGDCLGSVFDSGQKQAFLHGIDRLYLEDAETEQVYVHPL